MTKFCPTCGIPNAKPGQCGRGKSLPCPELTQALPNKHIQLRDGQDGESRILSVEDIAKSNVKLDWAVSPENVEVVPLPAPKRKATSKNTK